MNKWQVEAIRWFSGEWGQKANELYSQIIGNHADPIKPKIYEANGYIVSPVIEFYVKDSKIALFHFFQRNEICSRFFLGGISSEIIPIYSRRNKKYQHAFTRKEVPQILSVISYLQLQVLSSTDIVSYGKGWRLHVLNGVDEMYVTLLARSVYEDKRISISFCFNHEAVNIGFVWGNMKTSFFGSLKELPSQIRMINSFLSLCDM